MRATLAIGFLMVATALACGGGAPAGPRDDPPTVVPALESVPFELLGAGKIAFQRIGGGGRFTSTYVIDATARTSAHYFDNDPFMLGPSISPDGRRLAYAEYSDNVTLVDDYVANIDGTGVAHVSTFAGQEGPPTWTPDGAKVVILGGGLGSYQVYSQSPVANPSDRTQLTHFTFPSSGPPACPIIDRNDLRVSISSQGLLAFDCFWGEIDVVASTGALVTSYVPNRDDRAHWPNVVSPTWSPDGSRVAFIETTSDNVTTSRMLSMALKLLNLDGSVTTIVSIPAPSVQFGGGWAGYLNYSLCWTADGSRIVFTRPESDLVAHLWVVRADGSGLAQLTSAPDAWDRSVSCTR